jgi:uncharacterized protein (TIGR02246 family)
MHIREGLAMQRVIITLSALVAAGLAVGLVGGQAPPTGTGTGTTTAPATDQAAAIRKAVAEYCDAFNKGDVQAIAAFWAPDAEYTNETGTETKGRAAITALFRQFLADHKGAKMNLNVKSLRFIRSDVALGEGTSEVTTAEGPDKGRFSAAWVKADGKWLLTSARDLPTEGEAASPLQGLNWLVGEWQSEGNRTPVSVSCRPVLGKAYLHLDFTIKRPDGDLAVMYLFGYDPVSEQVKSWTFDSAGGYGEALWTLDGNQWVGQAVGVLPDGGSGSTTYVVKYTDDQTFTLQMRDREVGGQPLADSNTKYVRKAKP